MRRKLLKGTMTWCGLGIAAAILTGCQSDLTEQNARLMDENRGLRDQLGERNGALESAYTDVRDRDERIASLETELQTANSTEDPYGAYPDGAAPMGQYASPPVANPFGGIDGVTGTVGAGEITATLEGDVLFDAGKTSLKKGSKRSLDAIVSILTATYGGKTIRVAGHTDTDPIRKSGYKSNYHLGFERAFAVREYLVSQGVPRSQVYIASHGPDQAMSSKQASRRVEIAVVLND